MSGGTKVAPTQQRQGGSGGRGHSFRLHCPHCQAYAATRSSVGISPLTREIYYQCSNVHCGHTFVATLEIVRTLHPSATPNPAVTLTIRPPANDTRPPDRPAPKAMTG